MFAWKKIPLIRFAIPFVLGVFLEINLLSNTSANSHYYFFVIIFILLLVIVLNYLRKYKLRLIQGVLISLLILLVSVVYTASKEADKKANHFTNFLENGSVISGSLVEIPTEKAKTYKSLLKVKQVINNDMSYPAQGKIIVYFRKNDHAAKLNYGNTICIKNELNKIDPPKNPGQFNYKRFLSYKQIFHQAFLDSNEWQLQHKSKEQFYLMSFIYDIRIKIIALLKGGIDNPDDYSIASALLVGYKEDLSTDVRQSFASTGAMHVLAVSGLHVGIIFLVFSSLFKPVKKIRLGNLMYIIILLACLWFYAVITGLSPSVMRAATMFSFVVIGQNSGRHTNIYSSILTSLIFLLIIDPFLISQVGFQLSYAAVIGIVFMQPKIYGIWEAPNWFLDKLWALFAVSLAAQIATFPLGIYYFNQFPVYFFVSNLVVIPAATIIIYTGFLFLIFELIGVAFISAAFMFLLKHIIHFLNQSILVIQNFPAGLIEEIYLSNMGLVFLYASIIMLLLLSVSRSKAYLFASVIFILMFSVNGLYRKYNNQRTKRMVVYATPYSSLYGFFENSEVVFYGDSNILNDKSTLKYNTYRDLWHHGLRSGEIKKKNLYQPIESHSLYSNEKVISYQGKSFLILDKEYNRDLDRGNQEVDFVIIRNNPYFKVAELKNRLNFSKLIIDSSNKWWLARKWKEECESLAVPCHDVGNDGAFVLAL